MSRDETVAVKGSPIKSLLKFLDSELTPEQREKILHSLPVGYASRLRAPVLATEWVPVVMLNMLTEEAARAKGETVDQFARRAGRAAASEAFSGVYRVFAMILTPTALLGKASQIWGSLYNRGEMKVEAETSHGARIRLLNFPSEPAGCARITGWMERMVELTGVKSPQVTQVRCFAKGGPACEWELSWK